MKKLLAIALIATSFAACNDSEKKTDETTMGSDSTTVITPGEVTKAPDTMTTVVKDTMVKTTTTTTPMDSTKK